MATTITGLTAARMKEIEDATIIGSEIRNGDLILLKHDGTEINSGPVIGPPGPQGPMGPVAISAIPAEVKLWPGSVLPDLEDYGKWVWADGAVYPNAAHPLAAAVLGVPGSKWRTFDGASDPGGSNFRVPDLRGLVAAGMDAMPGGQRANRMGRSVAITLAERTGRETYDLKLTEMPHHNHGAGVGQNEINVGVSGGISGTTTTVGGHQHDAATGGGFVKTNQNRNLRTDGSSAYSIITGVELTNVAGGHNHTIESGSFNGSGQTFIAPKGDGTAHENVQPTVFVPYIVYLDVV